jgi:hypothetical protein
MTIINDDSSIVNKLGALLTDDARVIIYDRHMFMVQAIGFNPLKVLWSKLFLGFVSLIVS